MIPFQPIAKRGDLAIIHAVRRAGFDRVHRYELAVVTSITRERHAKAVRIIADREAAAGQTAPTQLAKLTLSSMVAIPATDFRVTDAIAAIVDHRADAETGSLPAYANPLDLLRDLRPWTIGDTTCLDTIHSAAYRHLQDTADQRCDDCGVVTQGSGRIDASGPIPTVHCQPACPIGVNFTTNYPIGLTVEITDGFAAGATATIERVSDSYPADLYDKTIRHYSGRSYTVTLPHWGQRTLGESIFRPCDPALADTYTVRRETAVSR